MLNAYFRKAIFKVAFLCMLILLMGLGGCGANDLELKANFTRRAGSNADIHGRVERQTLRQKQTNRVDRFSIGAVGDLMFHNTQISRAYDATKGTYDFHDSFTHIKPYLHQVDYVFGNFETTLPGSAYSGYPLFRTPDTVLDAIKDAGIDFLSTANNHSLDSGEHGLQRTIEQLNQRQIPFTGTFSSPQDREAYTSVEVEGVRFAVVNYTYATNGLTLPGKMDLINTLDYYEDDNLLNLYADVKAAEQSDCDYVLVMLHFGYEYVSIESERIQRDIVKQLIGHGADIIFGGHPHVLQPVELFYELDGVAFEEPKVVIYSLGNFIASQRNVDKLGGNTDLGVIFNVYFETYDRHRPRITGIGFLPTYTLWQKDTITTIPISEDLSLLETYNLDIDTYTYTPWDDKRIAFGQTYTVDHLMRYIDSERDIEEKIYMDQGFYRYDFD